MKRTVKSKDAKRRVVRPPAPPRQRPVLLDLEGLVILTLIAYANSLNGEFVFDDQLFVVNDPGLARVHTFTDVFTNGSGWRSLLFATYGLNRYWNGLNPFGYHLVNVILHATNVVLVYFIV